MALYEMRKFVAPEFIFGVGSRRRVGFYAKNMMARRVLVVTDAFHVPRSRYIFARLGLEVTVAGVYPAHLSAQWWLAHLREAAALPWTMLRVEAFRLRRG